MTGVHDLGGMRDFGAIRLESNEPVFHAPWEGRIYALNMAMTPWRKWTIDRRRYARELIPPAQYLAMSYYEKFYAGLITNLLDAGLVTQAEIDSGVPASAGAKLTPALKAAAVGRFVADGAPYTRDIASVPRFRIGQRVRSRNINPTAHTRLPRYARGKTGVINRDHGVFVFPDSNAVFLGEKPQHLYSVRFGAHELWGEEGKHHDSVYVHMWDDYLEPS
jgi:nitrile hydratase beta subunit